MEKAASHKPYALVIAPRPVRQLFSYSVPARLDRDATPGRRVVVPFGPRKLIGLIVRRTDATEVKTRPIEQVIDTEPVVSPRLLELALWTADYYFAPPGDVVAVILPRDAKIDTLVKLIAADPPATRSKPALKVYTALAAKGGERKLDRLAADLDVPVSRMKRILAGDVVRSFTALSQTGRVAGRRHERERPSDAGAPDAVPLHATPVELTREQSAAVDKIIPGVEKGEFGIHLIHGVTASGKTEVYARLAAETLARGKSILALAPEIALADLVAERFERRLGVRAAVLHSDLTPSERAARWEAVRSGEARVVVGARSAVFAPVQNLGCIIVDEEHDPSYKQEESPRYHGRDVAIKRGSIERVPVVLGSATPSMESYHHAMSGRYDLIELSGRRDARAMPKVELVMAEKAGEAGSKLREEIQRRLAAKEQTLLFLNRRGAARYIQCEQCGHVFECRNCSLSLVYHASSKSLRCHTCGYAEPAPDVCAACGNDRLYQGGAGTQKIERDIAAMFPDASIARMDRDTTEKRRSGAAILKAVGDRSVDILVGTQMVTKGHDFPGITLVGVVSADDTLHVPDFRASERTFQQITQAAGRAGRGEAPGTVIVQTFSPDSHAITAAARHDYAAFYTGEAPLRELALYPPFVRLALVRIESASQRRGDAFVERIRAAAPSVVSRHRGLVALGPEEAVVFRVKNRWRWRMLLKAPSPSVLSKALNRFMSRIDAMDGPDTAGVTVTVDVDPVDVM